MVARACLVTFFTLHTEYVRIGRNSNVMSMIRNGTVIGF